MHTPVLQSHAHVHTPTVFLIQRSWVINMVYICNNTVVLTELTIPFNSPCRESKQGTKQKTNQATLSTTHERLGFNGEESYFGDNRNWVTWPLSSIMLQVPYKSIFEKSKTRDLFDSAARTATSASSYAIFVARKNSHWMSDRMLLTWNVCLSTFYLCVANYLSLSWLLHALL